MLLIFKCVVTSAGTPGPLLGDDDATTVTMLYPSALTTNLDTLGTQRSVINQSTRQDYSVARLTIVGIGDNGGAAYLLARGSALVDGRRVAAYGELPAIGGGVCNDINLGDFDVDAAAGGDGVVVWAEIR